MSVLNIFQPTKKYDVFISYSRADEKIIPPIVKLVRTLINDKVFQDVQDIEGGAFWKDKLQSAIEGCKIIMIFWCEHSAASKAVKEEYETAIKHEKKVLPLLLDKTAMPEVLRQYQWIDMTAFHVHSSRTLPPPPPFSTDEDLEIEDAADSDGAGSDEEILNYSTGPEMMAKLIARKIGDMLNE